MLSGPQNSSANTGLAANHLAANLLRLRERIAAAASRAGRDVDSVTLLAVSKGQSVATLRAAQAQGLADFGENYVEEALPKITALCDTAPAWHFIGRPQANKTQVLATHFDWVHGIDRERIATRLSEQRPAQASPLNICLQVNVAGEASKGGLAPADLPALLDALAVLPRLRLRGLMCMLPYGLDEPGQRAGFSSLRELLERANGSGHALDTLSMGMSGDFEAAVQEGATVLRIGTALFGPRG
jgi:pyridoxal phosphate enzyme (YggS family)